MELRGAATCKGGAVIGCRPRRSDASVHGRIEGGTEEAAAPDPSIPVPDCWCHCSGQLDSREAGHLWVSIFFDMISQVIFARAATCTRHTELLQILHRRVF